MSIWVLILSGVSGVLALTFLMLVIAPALGGAIRGGRFLVNPFHIAGAAVFTPLFLVSLYWLGVFG